MLWAKSAGAVRRVRRNSRPRFLRKAAIRAAAYSVETLEQRCLLSTVTWTGAAGDLKWATAGNWSGGTGTNGLPGAGQDVFIPTAAPTITAATGTLSINTLTSGEPISFTSGALTVVAGSTLTASFAISGGQINLGASSSIAGITQSSGTIAGAGPLDVTGLYNWSGGILAVTGTTTTDGGMSLTGINQVLSGAKLTNPAGQTITLASTGALFFENQSTLNNAGTLNATSGAMNLTGTLPEVFNNSGTFNVAMGVGNTFTLFGNANGGVSFNNITVATPTGSQTGTLSVQSGTMLVEYTGTAAGSVSISANAVLDFQSATGYILSTGISGAGGLAVTGGSLTVSSPLNLGGPFNISAGQIAINASTTFASTPGNTVGQTGGTIAGTGPLDMKGQYVLSAGTLAVTGITTTDGGISFSGNANPVLSGANLTNPTGQTATFGAAGAPGNITLYFENQATFTNAGTFNAINGEMTFFSTPTETFINSGTLNVSTALSDTFTINGNLTTGVTFNNSGALSVQSGTLLINSGGADSGSISVSAAALLDFQPFDGYTVSAGITGPGTVAVTGGTLTVNTGLNLAGPFNISGGQIALNAAATFSNTVTQSGGTISGPGPLDIKGQYVFSNGTLAVTGTTTTDGGIYFSGNGNPVLSGAKLTNPAGQTVTFGSTGAAGVITLYFENQSTFTNSGTLNAINGEMTFFSTPTEAFVNTGTFNVTAAPTDTFTINGNTTTGVTFNNTGALNVQSGTLLIVASGTDSGSASVSAGAVLDFLPVAGYTLSAGITGSGLAELTGGTLTVANPLTIAAPFSESAGLLAGPGPLTLSKLFTWTAGSDTVASVTTGGGISFQGIGTPVLNGVSGAVLINPAGSTAAVSGTVTLAFQNGGIFENDGVVSASANGGRFLTSTGGGTFNNVGSFTVDVPSGTFSISNALTDPGAVDVQSGMLLLTGIGSITHALTVEGNGILDFQGNYTLSGEIDGAGTTAITGGTVNTGAGAQVIKTPLSVSAGTLSGTGSLSLQGLFTWSAGTLAVTTVTASGGIDFHGATTDVLNGATLTNTQNATIGASGSETLDFFNTSKFVNAGTLTASSGQFLFANLTETFSNTGVFSVTEPVTGTFPIDTGITMTNTGTVSVISGTLSLNGAVSNISGAATSATLTGGVWNIGTNTTSGTLIIAGNMSFTTNAATIVLDDSGSTITNPTKTINALAALSHNATGGSLTLLDGQDLSVTPAGGTLNNDGLIALNAASTLNVTGTFNQVSDGTLAVQLSAAGFGQVTASSLVALAGTVQANLAPGFDPPASTTFAIATAPSVVNNSATLSGGPTPSGRGLLLRFSSSSAIIAVLPLAPTGPQMTAATDTGISQTDGITKNNMPQFTGNAFDPGTIDLFADGSLIGTAAFGGSGAWTVAVASAMADGSHRITAKVVDTAGDAGPATAPLTIVIDTVAPAAPSTPALSAASDTGIAGDNLTNQTTPTFVGTAETGSTVTLFADGSAIASGVATGGSYSITAPALTPGAHTITTQATDVAGNVGQLSTAEALTIDTTPPLVSATTPAAIQTAGTTTPVSQFQITFSEPLIPADAASSANYQLVRAGPDGLFGTADDVSYALTPQYAAGQTAVTLVNPGGTLPQGMYRLTINATAPSGVQDLAGNLLNASMAGGPGANYVRIFNLAYPFLDSIAGTTGADTISITRDGDGQHVNWSLNGGPISTLPLTDPFGLTITGSGGADTIALNGAGSVLPASVHLNGSFTLTGLQSLNGTSLDIGKSTVYVNYAGSSDPLSLIRTSLHNGYNNGAWNGQPTGSTDVITTSSGSSIFGIGYADSADGTGVNPVPNTVELKYTVAGDANLDGSTNLADFLLLARNFGSTSSAWDHGDLNYDGATSLPDLLILVRNFGQKLPVVPAIVTDPSALDPATDPLARRRV